MTTTQRTPIYTSRELAEALAEHDRAYPKHGRDCSCRHGLIRAAREWFASMGRPVPMVVNEPRPYVSPDVLRGTTVGPVAATGELDALARPS